MSASALSLVFQSITGLVVLLVLWLACVAGQRVIAFRHCMFVLRDELFDFAKDGNIDFHDPAYNLLRNLMNGFIRYAHRLTCFQLTLTFARWEITGQIHPLTWHDKWQYSLSSIPDYQADELRKFHARAMDAVASHLIAGSPLLMIGLVVAMLSAGVWTSVRSMYRDAAERVVTRVVDSRKLETLAVQGA